MTTSISTFRSALLAAALVFAPFSVALHAQTTQPVQANIPFVFQNGSSTFAAGTYTLTPVSGHILNIHGQHNSGLVMMNVDNDGEKVAGAGKVVFQRYGDKYFLREVWKKGESEHVVFVKTPEENKVRNAAKTQIAATSTSTVEVAVR